MGTQQHMCLLLLSLTIARTCAGAPTICVAPACAVGEPTSVTCIFHKYINVTKDNIVVTHYAFGTSIIDRGNDALFCYWTTDADKPTCTAEDGYQFNGNITNRLTLGIPSATKEAGGKYACRIITADDTVVHECDLDVQERRGLGSNTDSTPANDDHGGFYTYSDYPEATTISNIIVGVLLGASLIFNVYFLHKGGHLRIICRLLHAKQRDSKINDIECTEQLVSMKETHLSQLPVGQYWSAVIVPERGNNSSQTDNVVETTDASVLALHRPDDNPKPKPSNSTTGNALEIFNLSGQTTKPPVVKNQGIKPKLTRGHSHPPFKNDNVHTTQQVDFNTALGSPSDQVHPKGNHHDAHVDKKKKHTGNQKYVELWRRAVHCLNGKEKSSTGNVLEKEDAAYRQTRMKKQSNARSLHSHED